ncbi:hypothetical protein [Streptomyces sp. NBC_00893]|uniref:hypothetical protein n=1 Tax=Streptomyces sp. NBC_00893 TaxID=2975862 RepID=UPI00224D3E05|nr:hypothetical protein [Streptomyces sp. NBC_00893]MCX4847854.1 hypothetical protein [Streptomyces sp. NBC_00893]
MPMIILRANGNGQTGAMDQTRAKNYLINILTRRGMLNRLANLSQALTQAFNGGGFPTHPYVFNGFPVLHASAGNYQTSVTLFYYLANNNLMLFAVGEHIPGPQNRYRITIYGQAGTNFAMNSIV